MWTPNQAQPVVCALLPSAIYGMFKAKPARNVVGVRPLRVLKAMV